MDVHRALSEAMIETPLCSTPVSPCPTAGALRSSALSIPGLHAEYARLAPGETLSVTRGHAIGVAFTPQPDAVWDVGGSKRRSTRIPEAAVIIAPREGLNWYRWTEVSESVEMWIDDAKLSELSLAAGGPAILEFDHHDRIHDPVIVNIASAVRAAIVGPRDIDTLRIDAIATLLVGHVLERYHQLRVRSSSRVRPLDREAMRRVADYIAAHLDRPLSITELAAVAYQSPFHFAKAFHAAAGTPPHAYVTARRMDRAMVLLRQTSAPLWLVAQLLGYQRLSHFRRQFLRAWGTSTRDVRRELASIGA
jgi:AraC family transcriptional regulator